MRVDITSAIGRSVEDGEDALLSSTTEMQTASVDVGASWCRRGPSHSWRGTSAAVTRSGQTTASTTVRTHDVAPTNRTSLSQELLGSLVARHVSCASGDSPQVGVGVVESREVAERRSAKKRGGLVYVGLVPSFRIPLGTARRRTKMKSHDAETTTSAWPATKNKLSPFPLLESS